MQELRQRAHMRANSMIMTSRVLPDLYSATFGQGARTSAATVVGDPLRARVAVMGPSCLVTSLRLCSGAVEHVSTEEWVRGRCRGIGAEDRLRQAL